jgi:putative hydrolase of the HAD superfamily
MDDILPRALIARHLKPMAPIPAAAQHQGTLAPPIRCLLCDIYGTLFISGSDDPGASPVREELGPLLSPVLARHGVPTAPGTLMDRLRQAIARHHAAARQRGVDFPEVRIEEIWRELLPVKDDTAIRHFALEFEMVVNPVWPMPHMSALLIACRERHIHLGIISNAQFFTPGLFQLFLGESPERLGFDPALTFWSYRHGVAKPSDTLFALAAARLAAMGITPRHTAYLGNDMRKDILPARRAGFQTVLFAGDARSLRMGADTPRAETKPDLIVTDLSQLISWLGR